MDLTVTIDDADQMLVVTRGTERGRYDPDWAEAYRAEADWFGYVYLDPSTRLGPYMMRATPDDLAVIEASYHRCDCGSIAEFGRDCYVCAYQGDDEDREVGS